MLTSRLVQWKPPSVIPLSNDTDLTYPIGIDILTRLESLPEYERLTECEDKCLVETLLYVSPSETNGLPLESGGPHLLPHEGDHEPKGRTPV